MENKIYALTHLHSQDLYDADNRPKDVCKVLVEKQAKGLILTQHGVANIEPMRQACLQSGLKFCPGMEIYVQDENDSRRHLVLVALDDTGWQAIGMCATDAQNKDGYSVATTDLLEKYFGKNSIGHGHVAATSACVNGVLAEPYHTNIRLKKAIIKQRKRCEVYAMDPKDPELAKAKQVSEQIMLDYEALRDRVLATKKLAGTRFAAKEKGIERRRKNGEDVSLMVAELENAKREAEDAKNSLDAMQTQLKSLTKDKNKAVKEYKILQEKADMYKEIIAEMKRLESQKLSADGIKANMQQLTAYYVELFGDGNFYLEMQYHGFPGEDFVYPVLAEIAMQQGLPMCAANDVHMIDNSEKEILKRNILRSMRFGSSFETATEADKELYIKTDEELAAALSKILTPDQVQEAMRGARELFDRSNVEFKVASHYPKYPLPDQLTSDKQLENEVKRGIKWRFPKGLPEGYAQRLRHELKIIEGMGYCDYHLIVKDFLEYGRILGAVPADRLDEAPMTITEAKAWVKENGWTTGFSVGPGRGSAVGSLVCYLLGITSLDPMKYGLLFERFLNPERVSMPDIDSDIANRVRPKVIEYVRQKYGSDSVCSILTTNQLAPKGALRTAAKFYGLHKLGDGTAFLKLGDALAREVPSDVGTSFDTLLDDGSVSQVMKEKHAKDTDAVNIIEWAESIEGCMTSYGAHAAGIVISDTHPIKESMPLRWNENIQGWTTWCDMIAVEEKQFLKMDFLGLRTLDIITDCLREIKRNHGTEIDPLKLPLDDADVYEEIFCKGRTNSVFQFESDGMKQMLQRFRPSCFEDLIILVSMYRPGPLQYIDGVIDVKNGKEPEYLTPELKSILGNTYAGIVYQEQIMQIFQSLAGYTLGGADQVRRYMSKKKMDKLQKEQHAFIYGDPSRQIAGCVANGITEEAAKKLFDQMTDFAKYAFNKSHAAAYAYNSYATAYLKYHYPAEFLMAALNWVPDQKAIPGLVAEADSFDISVIAPNINHSEDTFSVYDNNIIYGLGAIKGVGSAAKDILAERRKGGAYQSLAAFLVRNNINKTAREGLIKAGALSDFGDNRTALLQAAERLSSDAKAYIDNRNRALLLANYLPLADICDDSEAVIMGQRELGLQELFSEPFTEAELKKKIAAAKQAAKEAKHNLETFDIDEGISEDFFQRLAEEKECMGLYVTMHPIDLYDTDGYTLIEDAAEHTKQLCGIVDTIKVTKRKKDGAPMAFVTLSDKTGSINACIFPKYYDSCMGDVHEGKAVAVEGNMLEDGKFAVSKATSLTPIPLEKVREKEMKRKKDPKKERLIIRTHSLPRWRLEVEPEFRKKFEDPKGAKASIVDDVIGEERMLAYRINEAALAENFTGMTISKQK